MEKKAVLQIKEEARFYQQKSQSENKKNVCIKLKETVKNVIRNLNDDSISNSSGLSGFTLMGAVL